MFQQLRSADSGLSAVTLLTMVQANTLGSQSSKENLCVLPVEQGGEGGWGTGSPEHLCGQLFPSHLQDTACPPEEALTLAHGVLINRPRITGFNVCSPGMRAPLAGLQVTVARHCGVREKQFGPMLLDKTTGWMSLHQWLDVSHIVAPSNTWQEGTSILRGQLLLGDLLQTTSSWTALLKLVISYTSFCWWAQLPHCCGG